MKLTMISWMFMWENPRDRGMEAVGFREIKLGFKDLDQEHIIYMNLLEEISRTCIFLEIFSAQKEEKERQIFMDSRAYMCSRLMEKVLECFLHLIYVLDARNMKLGWRSLREKVCVFLVFLDREWGRVSERVCDV